MPPMREVCSRCGSSTGIQLIAGSGSDSATIICIKPHSRSCGHWKKHSRECTISMPCWSAKDGTKTGLETSGTTSQAHGSSISQSPVPATGTRPARSTRYGTHSTTSRSTSRSRSVNRAHGSTYAATRHQTTGKCRCDALQTWSLTRWGLSSLPIASANSTAGYAIRQKRRVLGIQSCMATMLKNTECYGCKKLPFPALSSLSGIPTRPVLT